MIPIDDFEELGLWEPTLRTREGRAARLTTPLRRIVVIEILKAHGRPTYTRHHYHTDHAIVPFELVPEVEQKIDEMTKQLAAETGFVQGPEPDGACLSVYFKGDEALAERIAAELNIEVTTSIRGLKYVHHGWQQKIRDTLDQWKLWGRTVEYISPETLS